MKKVANFRALPKLAKPHPPPPNSGNLVLFFPDVKTTFYAYDRKKVPMMIMIIAMIIMIVMMVILMIMMKKLQKKHTNIMTFQQKCTNLRNFYLVKKGPKHLGIGKPPPHPHSGNARKLATFFNGCLP